MIRRAFVLLLATMLLGAGLLFYWAADANRFKPELQSLLAEHTGIPVTIQGDLSWQLFPPLVLNATSIAAEHQGQQWRVGNLALDLDLMTIVRKRDVDQWRVQALQLRDVAMLDDGDRLRVHELDLRDFSLGKPSPLNARLDYTTDYAADGSAPIALALKTLVTYHPDPQAIELTQGEFAANGASGVCDLTVRPVNDPGALPEPHDNDLVSIALLRSFEWHGQCALDQITVEQQTFDHGTLSLENTGAIATSSLELPELFGGRASIEVVTNAAQIPLHWQITPTLNGVDSERLMAWLDQRLQWVAALAYGGRIEFTGNTQREALASLSGDTTFDAGQGTISITKIKQPLLKIATLLKEPDRISRWPDLWDYQQLAGDWRIRGAAHQVNFALDNLTVTADGSYDVLRDNMDMLAELQFATLPEGQMFDVNPLLMDLPIPIRCVGSADAPTCGLVADAAQRIVTRVLTSDENSALRATINEKIDTEVPEQYREAARGLLDLLGGALDKND